MVDLLVALLAFFLGFQLASIALSILARHARLARVFQGSRGLALVFLPVLFGLGVAALSVLPHILGGLAGEAHASSDQDLLESGRLSPFLMALLVFLGVRLLFRILIEGKISLHLLLARREPSDTSLAKVQRAFEPFAESRHLPELRFHASSRYYEPFVRGLIRPAIYLHLGLVEELTDQHLRAALLHEMGHSERGDHLVKWLYSVVLSPIGFARGIRLGYDEWTESSERKCDDLASELVGSRRAVAEALVAVFRLASAQAAPLASAGLCGHRSIKQRVARLLSPDQDEDASEARGLLAGSGLVVFSTVLFVGLVTPSYGLELYCFLEHLVGTHCVG